MTGLNIFLENSFEGGAVLDEAQAFTEGASISINNALIESFEKVYQTNKGIIDKNFKKMEKALQSYKNEGGLWQKAAKSFTMLVNLDDFKKMINSLKKDSNNYITQTAKSLDKLKSEINKQKNSLGDNASEEDAKRVIDTITKAVRNFVNTHEKTALEYTIKVANINKRLQSNNFLQFIKPLDSKIENELKKDFSNFKSKKEYSKEKYEKKYEALLRKNELADEIISKSLFDKIKKAFKRFKEFAERNLKDRKYKFGLGILLLAAAYSILAGIVKRIKSGESINLLNPKQVIKGAIEIVRGEYNWKQKTAVIIVTAITTTALGYTGYQGFKLVQELVNKK